MREMVSVCFEVRRIKTFFYYNYYFVVQLLNQKLAPMGLQSQHSDPSALISFANSITAKNGRLGAEF